MVYPQELRTSGPSRRRTAASTAVSVSEEADLWCSQMVKLAICEGSVKMSEKFLLLNPIVGRLRVVISAPGSRPFETFRTRLISRGGQVQAIRRTKTSDIPFSIS